MQEFYQLSMFLAQNTFHYMSPKMIQPNAAGFTGYFSYLKLPVFNENGWLKYSDGVPDI